MIKNKLKKVFLLLSICIPFTSCNPLTKSTEATSVSTIERNIEFSDEETIQKEELLFLTLTENYKLSDEHNTEDIKSFLMINENHDLSRNINYSTDDLKINKIKTISKKITKFNGNTRSFSNEDELNLNIYEIENNINQQSTIAITSNDERIGSLLGIIDEQNINYLDTNPVYEIFMDNLNNYVEDVCSELETFTIDDIESFKHKYNITDEEIENAKQNYQNSLNTRKFWGYDSWSEWKVEKSNLNELKVLTQWNQSYPYNSAIQAIEGKSYPTGCGTTALAQIMAYHKFPKKYKRDDLNILKNKWSLASEWDGIYDWDEMTSNPNAFYISQQGKICIGALMYEISKGINSSYSLTGTSSTMNGRISYLRKIGYKCDNQKTYTFKNISSSLQNNCPVMIRGSTSSGSGHAWIIDGSLELARTRNYYIFWIPFRCKEKQDFVHCNYGWGGYDDDGNEYNYNGKGYYKSRVFSTTSSDLSSDLKICTNIKPK